MRRAFLFSFLISSIAQAGDVTTYGKCEKNVLPDRVALVFSAEQTEPKAAQAQKRTAEIYEAIKTEVKKMNFKDQELETEAINVYEDVDWNNNKKVSKGFKSTISLKFITSEIDRAGSVIPVVLKAGAKGLGQLQLFVSDATYDKAYHDCLAGAVANAQEKAKRLLKGYSSGDLKLTEVIEGQESSYRPMLSMAKAEMQSDGDAGPTLETKTQKISVSVTAKFKF